MDTMALTETVRRDARWATEGDLVFIGGAVARVVAVEYYRPADVPNWAPVRPGLAARRIRTASGSRWWGIDEDSLPCVATDCACGGPASEVYSKIVLQGRGKARGK